MFKLEFFYDGKKYDNFEDAATQAAIDGIKDTIIDSLKPFEAEIINHGGSVVVNVPPNLENIEITFKDLPEDLIKSIEDSFEEE